MVRSRALGPALLGIAVVLVGCGGGGGGSVDAGDDGSTGDAAIDGGLASCMPGATLDSAPQVYNSTVSGSSDFDVAAGSCAAVEAPFGVAAAGPDEVLAVRGLSPGTDYAIRLISGADLAFYVASGCSDDGAISDCLLFVDGSIGALEVGRFTAPANGSVVVVVDHWEAEAPSDGSYTVELFAVECDDDSACSGATPECVDHRCAECDNSFDCSSSAAPICDAIADQCVAGVDGCTSDDPGEGGDDGPAGARDITPGGSPTVTSGQICNAPLSEHDFYRFDVATGGEHYTLSLAWANSGVDLDMQVLDADGVAYGLSLFERPETIALEYLPAGRYYVQVNYAATGAIATPVAYDLTATRITGDSCASVADCATEFRNQFFRSTCSGGACRYRIGDGSLTTGQICDSSPDCASGDCSAFPFTADADQRSVCTTSCSSDGECAAIGAGYVCTTYLADNICVPPCTTDAQCPVSLGAAPVSGPWFRLSCDLPSGKCQF